MSKARLGSVLEFALDQRGAIAAVTAVCLMVLMLSIGLAVDMGRSQSVHAAIQNDLDAALLGSAAQSTDPSELQANAQKYFDANWRKNHGVEGAVAVTIETPEQNIVTGRITVDVPTSFMALAGIESVKVVATSEIELAGENLEMALVLDVTNSMAGAKLDALKASSQSLVETVYSKPHAEERVRISIVPFGDYVNVGTANRGAPWLSVPADTSNEVSYCYDTSDVIGQSNCRMETRQGDNDGIPFTYEAEVCDYQYGPTYNKCVTYTDSKTWYGCAASRDTPLDTKDEDWTTPVPGAMNTLCGNPLMPLSSDKDALTDYLGGLSTFGNTYIPAGLMWGWTTLTKEAPFNEATGSGEKVDGLPVKKVLVLMTDGANTRSPDYVNKHHGGTDVTQANAHTQELCTNIKAKGITVYTVAFDVTDPGIKDILETCASSPSKFFDASDSEELHTAFSTIGSNLAPLRIAR
ncbi:MAG: VWA domain-containing protein [Hyphomicrobium sp.]|nr:VWA domain-containing protein [Hyphomicrobium sp.]